MKAPNITKGSWCYSRIDCDETVVTNEDSSMCVAYVQDDAHGLAIAAVPDLIEALLVGLNSKDVPDGLKAVFYMALRKAGCTDE